MNGLSLTSTGYLHRYCRYALQVLTIILKGTDGLLVGIDDLPDGYLINFLMSIDDLSSWVMNIHRGADDFPHRH